MWGVFVGVDRDIHVIPVDRDLDIADGHIVDMLCLCEPKIELNANGMYIVTHRLFN